MIYFSDFGGASTYAIAVASFNVDTGSTGTANKTTAALGGATPTFGLWASTGHDSANGTTETPGAQFNIGFSRSAVERMVGGASADNVATTNTSRNLQSSLAMSHVNAATTASEGDFGISAEIANGFTVDYGNAYTAAFRAAFSAFAVAGSSSEVITDSLGTGTSPVNFDTSFIPEIAILIGNYSTSNSLSADFGLSIGIVTNHGGSVNQRCVLFREDAGVAQGAPLMTILTDRVGGEISGAGAKTYDLTAGGFGSAVGGNGFQVTPSASAGSDSSLWLGMSFGATRQYALVDLTTPTGTGTWNITGVGFQPVWALVFLTNLTTTTTAAGFSALTTSDAMSSLGMCMIDANAQSAAVFRIDSGADPTDAASLMKDVAMMCGSATVCNAFEAAFLGWTSDGLDVNVTANDGVARKGFALFIG